MSPFFDHPSFYLAVGLALVLLAISIRGVFYANDLWHHVENGLGLLLGSTLLLTVFGPPEGIVTWKVGATACITVLTLFGGFYAMGFGIVCGIRQKRILTHRGNQTYATGKNAVARGWALVVIGVGGISGFLIFLWAFWTGNFHW